LEAPADFTQQPWGKEIASDRVKGYFAYEMFFEKPDENHPVPFARAGVGLEKGARARAGISGVYSMGGSPILVNLSVGCCFDYRGLFRITALAIRTGGMLELCNEDIAIFSFPQGGILEFMDGIGLRLPVVKTVVSPKEKGISKVNIRFQGR
jgi:hypothetical protein